MMSRIAFSQWEADLAVYATDGEGNATGAPIWLGGTVAKSSFTMGFAREVANISGQSYPNNQQLEETHAIELENVWMVKAAGRPGALTLRLPGLVRNQTYAVVIIWTDEETGVWVKRVYFGVKFPQLAMSSEAQYFAQKLQIEGGFMQETAGLLSVAAPTETADLLGKVRYVSSQEQVDLYTYDFESGALAAIDEALLAGRAEIAVADDFEVTFAGVPAMTITSAGLVKIKQLTATGGTYVGGLPRLEFYAGVARVASLSQAGELAVPGFRVAADDPGLSGEMAFKSQGGDWLAALDASGCYAPGVADTL